jgi:hypothetical protein
MCRKVSNGRDLPDLMSDRGMAFRTFDLMIGDMFLVHELRGIFGVQYFKFSMALDTFPFRDMAIPLNDIEMAFLAGHPSRDILTMIKTPAFDFNISPGFNVARGTTSHST